MQISDINRVVEQVSRDKGIQRDVLIKALEEASEFYEFQGWRQNKFTFMGVKMPVEQGVRKANSELFN